MISRPADDHKNKNRKSNEKESNYKSTRQQNWKKNKYIIHLNWKTDKKTKALVHLFSIKRFFSDGGGRRQEKNCCADIHDNWLSDWWCITWSSSRIDMIMNIEKRETMEQVHKWSFRITTNHKRYFFSFTRSSSSLVVDKKKRETRGRIIGPFLFLVLEKEKTGRERERERSVEQSRVYVYSVDAAAERLCSSTSCLWYQFSYSSS